MDQETFYTMGMYAGDTLATATRLAFAFTPDSNYMTPLSFTVEEGVTYRIVGMVAGNANSSGAGTFTLSWDGELSVKPPPAFRIIIR